MLIIGNCGNKFSSLKPENKSIARKGESLGMETWGRESNGSFVPGAAISMVLRFGHFKQR